MSEELEVRKNSVPVSVVQLPIIEEQLGQLLPVIQAKLDSVSSLAVTEENYKEMKKIRADLNKEYAEFRDGVKQVKEVVMAPLNDFLNGICKEVDNTYKKGISGLDGEIKDVEGGLKTEKQKELLAYWEEYRDALGLDSAIADPRRSGIKVGLTISMKSLKMQAREYLDRIYGDLKMIETLDDADEVLVEYRVSLSVTDAVRMVAERHKRIEEEKQRRIAEEESKKAREEVEKAVEDAVKKEEELVVPVVKEAPAEEIVEPEKTLTTAFRVSGTLEMLKELKAFLVNGGYKFESIKGEI